MVLPYILTVCSNILQVRAQTRMYRWSWRKLTGSLLGFSSSSCFTATVQVPDVFTQMRWSVASSETRFIRWENKGMSVDTMRSKTEKLLSLIISQIDFRIQIVFCYRSLFVIWDKRNQCFWYFNWVYYIYMLKSAKLQNSSHIIFLYSRHQCNWCKSR